MERPGWLLVPHIVEKAAANPGSVPTRGRRSTRADVAMSQWLEFSMTLTALVAIIGLLQASKVSLPIPVFLGPVPSAEGFVAPADRFRDSYQDVRDELGKNLDFQRVIRLVPDRSEAVLI